MVDLDFDIDGLDDPAPQLDSLDPSHYVETPSSAPSKRRLPLRANVEIEGRRYKGKRVSRSDAELDSKALGIFQSDDDCNEDDVEMPEKNANGPMPNRGIAGDEGSDGELEDSDEADPFEEDIGPEDGVESAASIERDVGTGPAARLEVEKEEKAIAQRLVAVKKRDQKRAHAVCQQRKLYDSVVDFRIRLEPMISLARSMPPKEDRASSMGWGKSEELNTAMTEAEAALCSLISETESAWNSSWPSEDVETPDEAQFEQWRDSALNLWGRRVEEASGYVPKGGFKAFDTSVTAQMKAALETGKHLERIQRVREKIPLIGGGVLGVGSNEMQFDDGEFYRVLLRDIIETGDAPGGGLRYSKLSKSGKVKKKRDTSFAKGKRLKFQVFDKLVGFLTPVPLPDAGPLDEVLANLFGTAGRMGPYLHPPTC